MRKAVNSRERALHHYLQEQINQKKNILVDRLQQLVKARDTCSQATVASSALLHLAETIDNSSDNFLSSLSDNERDIGPIPPTGIGSVGSSATGCGRSEHVYIASAGEFIINKCINSCQYGQEAVELHRAEVTKLNVEVSVKKEEENMIRILLRSLGSIQTDVLKNNMSEILENKEEEEKDKNELITNTNNDVSLLDLGYRLTFTVLTR